MIVPSASASMVSGIVGSSLSGGSGGVGAGGIGIKGGSLELEHEQTASANAKTAASAAAILKTFFMPIF